MQADPPAVPGHELGGHPFAKAIIEAHEKLAPKIAKANTEHVVNLLETFEADMSKYVAPIAQRLRDDPATPADLHELLDALSEPPHFGVSLAISFALGAILSPVIGAAFQPAVQGISNSAWASNPSQPLSPALLASAVIKGVETEGTAASEAAKSGISAGAFDVMVKAAGNAIGFEQAIELQRRGLLAGTTLEAVLRYSNVNPAFYAAALNLVTNPVGIGEVMNARIRDHLTDAQAQNLYEQAGGIPDQYAWRRDANGRPPGPMQVLELWNRGVIDEPTVDAMLAQSDLALQFQETVKELRHYFPPPRSIVPMLRSKAIDESQARQLLTYYGVGEPWATAFITEGTKPASGTVKELTAAKVVDLYEEKIITRAVCVARLDALGYSADDAEAFAQLADANVESKLRTSAVNKIHSRYVTYKIDKPTATARLSDAGLPQPSITQVFAFWDDERATLAPNLTVAQWQGAFRRGLKTHAEFVAGVRAYGYDADEAETLAGLALPPPALPKAAKSKDLTASQLVRLYQEGGIDAATLRTRLLDLGYDATEAGEIVALAPTDLTVAQLTKLYTAGTVDAGMFRARLLSMGYTADDATRIVSLAPPPPASGA